MKILYLTHPIAFQLYGGSELQLEKYYDFLKQKKIDVELFDIFNSKIKKFDFIHNFSLNPELFSIIDYARKNNLKIITNANYWNLEEIVWNNKDISFVKRLGYLILSKISHISILSPLFNFLNPSYLYFYGQKKLIKNSDIVIVNSKIEKEHVIKEFGINKEKIKVIYNGVDKEFENGDENLFYEKYKIKDFILYTGRIEPKKNTLNLIKAVKALGLKLVIIGEYNTRYPNYLNLVKKEIDNNIILINNINHNDEILKSVYKCAKVFVMPGFAETPSISALEAGLSGTNIVITNRGSTKEYFKNYVEYVNPLDFNNLKEKISLAYNKDKDDILKNHIKENFTWDNVLTRLKEVYKN